MFVFKSHEFVLDAIVHAHTDHLTSTRISLYRPPTNDVLFHALILLLCNPSRSLRLHRPLILAEPRLDKLDAAGEGTVPPDLIHTSVNERATRTHSPKIVETICVLYDAQGRI
ncbi:hypothetical protein IG631_22226 [Alternaria alternata]|nr:hypothetical protein IG631_22226 [Alternaria alternata]